MRSNEAHVLESIANPALPTLQIVEYRGETTESTPSETSVHPGPAAYPGSSAYPGRYTLRAIPQSAPAAPPASTAPTLRAAANGYGFEENTDASAQRHAQTPQVAAALRNAPGLAKLHAVTSESTDSADQLCLWYEPLDAGTLDKLLRARTLTPAEIMTLARTLHRALSSLKKVGEGRAELSAEYIALSAAGVPKLLLPDAVYREAAALDTEQLTAAQGNYARSAAALLWQAACGHTPEPSAARVPLSLRMVSPQMGATGTAPEGAPSSEWIERLGRALEYLLDAPAQEAALAGLSSVVALAEEVPPRPLNVYLSCSERARALIPAAVDPAPVQKLSKAQKAQRYLAEHLPRLKKPLSPTKSPVKTRHKGHRSGRRIPPHGAARRVLPPHREAGTDCATGHRRARAGGYRAAARVHPLRAERLGNGAARIRSSRERSGGADARRHGNTGSERAGSERTGSGIAGRADSASPHRPAEPRTAHARRRRAHPRHRRRTQPRQREHPRDGGGLRTRLPRR